MGNKFIRPYRVIPFDIGGEINVIEVEEIAKKLEIQCQEPGKFSKSLSRKFVATYKVTEGISLSIYSFGIGVFVVQDEDYHIADEDEKYAIGYCESRRVEHDKILRFESACSPILNNIINAFRTGWKIKHNKPRYSANPKWENKGLSYIMTVSYINLDRDFMQYEQMSSDGKHTLQILLQPSIAHEEDSAVINLLDEEKEEDPYQLDIKYFETPRNFWKGTNADIYISWAAVLVIQKSIKNEYINFINSLEVDLQAIWLYTYCIYQDLKAMFDKDNLLPSQLKKLKNSYQRLYNEFTSKDDSSMPVYVSEIKQELVSTSGIENEKNKLIEYLDYCIDEREAIEREHQRKYAWLNESLLFIIAYVDIGTTLFTAFARNFSAAAMVVSAIIAAVVFVLGITFIVRKG